MAGDWRGVEVSELRRHGRESACRGGEAVRPPGPQRVWAGLGGSGAARGRVVSAAAGAVPRGLLEEAARLIRGREQVAPGVLALEVEALAAVLGGLQQASRAAGVDAPQRVSPKRLRLWALALANPVPRVGRRWM